MRFGEEGIDGKWGGEHRVLLAQDTCVKVGVPASRLWLAEAMTSGFLYIYLESCLDFASAGLKWLLRSGMIWEHPLLDLGWKC